MPEAEIYRAVVESVLRDADEPLPEMVLRNRVHIDPRGTHDPELAQRVINDMHSENKIRWVAFEGFAWGGRPGA